MEGFDCFSAHSIGSIVSSSPTEGPPALLREDGEAHLGLTSDLTSQSPVGQTLQQGSRQINGGEKAMRSKSYVQLCWNTCLLMRRRGQRGPSGPGVLLGSLSTGCVIHPEHSYDEAAAKRTLGSRSLICCSFILLRDTDKPHRRMF